jgi:hypothetical protein
MDPFERILAGLSGNEPPHDIGKRMRQHFRQRYQRVRRVQAGLSCLLILLGFGVGLPTLLPLESGIALPTNGVGMAGDVLPVITSPQAFLQGFLGSAVQVQSSLAITLEITTWAALVVIALGAFMGLRLLLPTISNTNLFEN